jgi:lipoprotein-releasing system ATP-binding protein
MSDAVLRLTRIRKIYRTPGGELPVLKGVNLAVKAGEILALTGPSGSGKTTLLQIAGLLDTPTDGEVVIAGEHLTGAPDALRTRTRARHLGFVYQFHHLLPEFSALENIMLPQMLAGASRMQAAVRAEELLNILGLSARASHRPARLSGGEQQRVAIARALAAKPSLLLADEPTGNLDPATAEEVFHYLLKLARELGLAALVATHNMDLASRMDRVVQVRDGKLSEG